MKRPTLKFCLHECLLYVHSLQKMIVNQLQLHVNMVLHPPLQFESVASSNMIIVTNKIILSRVKKIEFCNEIRKLKHEIYHNYTKGEHISENHSKGRLKFEGCPDKITEEY